MSGSDLKQTVLEVPVRGLEMDSTATVPAFRIATYLEHARWESFKLTEFVEPSQFHASVVRAGVFEYFEPVRYGDVLEIRTWLARVGNTSYDFGHRITHKQDHSVVARSRAILVQVGQDGPTPVNRSLRGAIHDEPAPIADPWPDAPPSKPFTREFVVRPSDQDSFRHVNQAMYVAYIDDTRRLAAIEGHPAGVEGRLTKLSVEYIREAHAGERVQMKAWVTAPDARAFELTDGGTGELLSRGQVRFEA